MNSCFIFYFSGTGNTEFIAKKFQEYLRTKNYAVALQAIDLVRNPQNLDGYSLIGIGFPIYAWNLPINVRRLINKLPKIINKDAFIFVTMGGPTSLGALGITADLLKKKGFKILSAVGFEMPSNDNILFDTDDPYSERSKQLRQAAVERVKKIVDVIQSGKGKIHGNSIFMKLLSWLTGVWINKIYRPYFHYHKFYVDEKCLPECRMCEEFCPVNNIKKIDIQKVIFDRTCILCARCINCCPVQAIQYGKSQKKYRYKDIDYIPPILR
jgi:flavodoxin/NAD-dependent dihydropyrimidine dehydrogenase PreA subunit